MFHLIVPPTVIMAFLRPACKCNHSSRTNLVVCHSPTSIVCARELRDVIDVRVDIDVAVHAIVHSGRRGHCLLFGVRESGCVHKRADLQ